MHMPAWHDPFICVTWFARTSWFIDDKHLFLHSVICVTNFIHLFVKSLIRVFEVTRSEIFLFPFRISGSSYHQPMSGGTPGRSHVWPGHDSKVTHVKSHHTYLDICEVMSHMYEVMSHIYEAMSHIYKVMSHICKVMSHLCEIMSHICEVMSHIWSDAKEANRL